MKSQNQRINEAIENIRMVLDSDEYGKVLVWLTGKPESTILFHICNELDKEKKCEYVYFYTEITLGADMEHYMGYLSEKYNQEIVLREIDGIVQNTCNKFGVPFLSIVVSYNIARLQEMDFKWEDEKFEVLCKKYLKEVDRPSNRNTIEIDGKFYKGSYGALRWWCNQYDSKVYNINKYGYLKEFIMNNPPDFRISDKCCKEVIKKPLHQYATKNEFEIVIYDSINVKGSIRDNKGSQFIKANFINRKYDQYMPLFGLTQKDIVEYKELYDLKFSDSYEVYHNNGGGCIGCPYGGYYGIQQDMRLAERFAQGPGMFAKKIFGKSYDYTKRYTEYAEKNGKRFYNKRGRIFV